ncbi:MAG TPA: LytTR family DNA-binding domain-containing protein [Phnomibacter sp.]|nr:LytTR family DNA-binding domain-containing protein [Phnomibacter sp.]
MTGTPPIMTAIAIDDEPLALEVIKAHAEKIPFLHLAATFSNAMTAMGYLLQHPVDLLFLDIKMPDVSGLEFYGSLPRKPLVIFTTAYAEHAASGFELDAIDYLLKPFSLPRFAKACNKALELHNYRQGGAGRHTDHIIIRSGNEQVKVAYNDILYAEATGNYVSFVLPHKKILSRSTFAEAILWLPAERFIRIHRSYLVNLQKIDKADKTQVWVGGQALPLSETLAKPFFEKWK